MKKKAFLEILQKRLKQIDETNQFGIQYLEGVTDMFWQRHAMNYMYKNNGDSTFFTKRYSNNSILTDSNTFYYINIPANTIKLPQTKNSIGSDGIMKVFCRAEPIDWPFIPIRERDFYNLQKSLLYSQDEDEFYYYVKYDKIYFSDNLNSSIINIYGVEVDLMPTFTTYTMTEDLPLPTEMENMIWVDVINFLSGQVPPDLLNNNKDD